MSFIPTPINPTTTEAKPSPFIAFTQRVIPATFDESLSYQEALYALLNYLQKEVIPTINANAEVTEQQTKVIDDLVKYVNEYFDNLDVQEEINNKLDEMAEDGTLTEIITAYLQMKSVLGFNTVNDMSEATNVIDGSICYVIGKDTYNDGKGVFYKIRTLVSTDVVDGDNIVALDVSPTLIAEKMPNYYITHLSTQLQDLDDRLTEEDERLAQEIQNIIDQSNQLIELRRTKEIKFNSRQGHDSSYYTNRAMVGSSNSLPFHSISNTNYSFPSIQGCAVYPKTGEIYYVNETQIYTIDQTVGNTQHVLFTGNYGHGGDCCILDDNIYITDSDANQIHSVNLVNGVSSVYSIDSDDIKNSDHNYNPKLAGICMNSASFAYICVCDEENPNHTIQAGSTIRFYKFNYSDSSVTKLFEIPQEIVYVQGITKDSDYFYMIGNKPFSSNYTGSKLYIFNIKDFSIFDILENSMDEEFEGLDYGSALGIEGLFTVSAKWNVSCHYGVLAFYGNNIRVYENLGGDQKVIYTVANHICNVYLRIPGTFNHDTTVELTGIVEQLPTPKCGDINGAGIDLLADMVAGSSRNFEAQVQMNTSTKKLIVRPLTSTQDSTFVVAHFTYAV